MQENGVEVPLNSARPVTRYKSIQPLSHDHYSNELIRTKSCVSEENEASPVQKRLLHCCGDNDDNDDDDDDGWKVFLGACIPLALSSTIALILSMYLAPVSPQVLSQGVVLTDSKVCSDMGLKVMKNHGSSVDCAIVAALCLAIIHPQSTSIGGGGVILVHDRRTDKSKVIDFTETAPSALKSEMLEKDQRVVEKKPGLLVAVPGMLHGLHQAHKLYGRSKWKHLVTRVAKLARDGFNVPQSLAKALSALRAQSVSKHFKKVFMPHTHAPPPGFLMKQPNLAALLDRVSDGGVDVFYSGTLSQEMASEVQAHGGVLTEDDLKNYSTVIRRPLESIYEESVVLTAPPPHAGAALISSLNVLQHLNLTATQLRKGAYHWIAESLKAAYVIEQQFGDPLRDPSSSNKLSKILSFSGFWIREVNKRINSSTASSMVHHSAHLEETGVSDHVMVMGPDDLIMSFLSSLNRPFGSRIMTRSGILLNSQILDFSWPNKTKDHSQFNPSNRVEAGKRPLSFLMPTVVKPLHGICGPYLALESSDGAHSLSAITQVLLNVLSFQMTLSEGVARGRLHPQRSNNTLLVDSEFGDEDVRALHRLGHRVQRAGLLSTVQGVERVHDIIRGVTDPRNGDHITTPDLE